MHFLSAGDRPPNRLADEDADAKNASFFLRAPLCSIALTVPKLKFGGFYCSFETVDAVLINKFLGSQSLKFLANYFFGLTEE